MLLMITKGKAQVMVDKEPGNGGKLAAPQVSNAISHALMAKDNAVALKIFLDQSNNSNW